ncbi:MAG: ClpXP protease specificity-enhancing factor [Colwellia sp.]|nr:ClpXP protease specificity-enhancing factor [Colwellia sp.]
MTSNKPYLIGAFYDWISDNDLTPYIVVDVSVYGVLVPMSYVVDGQITLNISSSALGDIAMGEEAIEFSARFGGKLEHITVPYGAVAAIYAKENGAGTSFPIEHPVVEEDAAVNKPKASKIAKLTSITSLKPVDINIDSMPKESTKKKGKASLKVIK